MLAATWLLRIRVKHLSTVIAMKKKINAQEVYLLRYHISCSKPRYASFKQPTYSFCLNFVIRLNTQQLHFDHSN